MVMGQAGERIEPQLFPLLRAIQEEGKLTLATRRLGLSYRYAWDLLGKWSKLFGDPLVRMERGKGAQLTPLGTKFVWAEQRIAESSFPRLESIASELNAEIGKARGRRSPELRVHASHGYSIEKLPELMRKLASVEVELRFMGSNDALASLSRGECDLAGFHLPIGSPALTVWRTYSANAQADRQRIIRMITREQGLMVARGNPLKLRSISDLARRDVRFVNRQAGSGTRLLLDALLAKEGLEPAKIRGYERAEFSESAIAAFVSSGVANVGFGIEAAARHFGLDFIHVATERYMLACHADALALPAIEQLIVALSGAEFRDAVATVPGSKLDAPGTVCTFADLLPSDRKSRKIATADVKTRGSHGNVARSHGRRSGA